jgi:hypothetical protein
VVGALIIVAFATAVAVIILVFGGPAVLAILPILIAGGVLGFLQVYRRREEAQGMRKFREDAKTEKTEFTPRDRETQA